MLFKFNCFSSYSTLAALLATLSGPLTAVQTASSSSSSSTAATSTTPTQSNEAENIFSQLPDEQVAEILSYLPDFHNNKQYKTNKRFNRIAKDHTLKYNVPLALKAKIETLTHDALAFFSEAAIRPQNQQTWRDMNSALSQKNLSVLETTNLFTPLSELNNKTIAIKIAAHAGAFFQINPYTNKNKQLAIEKYQASGIIGALSVLLPEQIDALAQAYFFSYDCVSGAPAGKIPFIRLTDDDRTNLIASLPPFSAEQITALASSRFFRDLLKNPDNTANLEELTLQIAPWSPEKIIAFGESATLNQYTTTYDLAEKAKAVDHKTPTQIRHFEAFLKTALDTTLPSYLQLTQIRAMARVRDEKLPEFKTSLEQLSADSFLKTTRPDHRLPLMIELINNYVTHQERLDFIKAVKVTRLMQSPAQRTQDNGSVAELMKLTEALNLITDDDNNAALLATITAMTTTVENIGTQDGQAVIETIWALAHAEKTPEEVDTFIQEAYQATENLSVELSGIFSRISLIEKMAIANTDPANMRAVIDALSQYATILFGDGTPKSAQQKLLDELMKLTVDQIAIVATSPCFVKYKHLDECPVIAASVGQQQIPEADLGARLGMIAEFAQHCESYSHKELFNNLITKPSQELKGLHDTLFNPSTAIVDSKLPKYAKGSMIMALTKHKKSDVELAEFFLNRHFSLNFFDNYQSQRRNILGNIMGMPTSIVEGLFKKAAYLSATNIYGFDRYISLQTKLWKLQNPLT